MRQRLSQCLLVGSSVYALFLALPAAAQSTGAQTTPQSSPTQTATPSVEAIVVTAEKREENINRVPMSVTAATGDQLRQVGVTDTAQLAKLVPGFTYQEGNYGTPVYGIRGISFFDGSAEANPAVGVYVDQIPLPFSVLSRGAQLDVQRVEVLKGPQGTLFGENSTGGAINYIANKPTDHFEAGGDVTYGRFNQADIDGYVSGPVSDTVSVRLAAMTEQRGDWQYSQTRTDHNGEQDFNEARLLIDWKPSSTVRFELNLNGWQDGSDTAAVQFEGYHPGVTGPTQYAPAAAALSAYAINPGPPTNAQAANWDPGFSLQKDDRFLQGSLRGEWDIVPGITLTSLSSIIYYGGKSPYDLDGTDYDDARAIFTQKFNIYTQELRLSGTEGPLKWMVGGNYEGDTLQEVQNAHVDGTDTEILGLHFTNFAPTNFQDVETQAAFGGLDYDLGSGVTLQGSVRYTTQTRGYSGCSYATDQATATAFSVLSTVLSGSPSVIRPGQCTTLNVATLKPVSDVTSELDQNNLSWRLGANWQATSNTLFYVNVTKGYKAGGYSNLPLIFASEVTDVTQESVLAYEAGTKVTAFDGQVQLDAAGFYYDYRNKQISGFVNLPIFGALPAQVNVPKSSIAGGEVDLAWYVTPDFRLSAGATYIDAHVDGSFLTDDPFGTPINIKGEQLPNAPKWQTNLDAQYSFALQAGWKGYVGGDLTYHTSSYSVFGDDPSMFLPGYPLLDLRLGANSPDGHWGAQLWGHNVLNKYYWYNAEYAVDTIVRYPGMPATFGFTLSYKY